MVNSEQNFFEIFKNQKKIVIIIDPLSINMVLNFVE